MTFRISNRSISADNPPFVIAEMSGNHNQSLDRALEIVTAAANSGASAIKLQTYTADTLTLDSSNNDFTIKDSSSIWSGQNLHSLYEKGYTPWEWHETIFDKAHSLGLICLSSPFDETAVDFLESINCPAYKIASFEIVHLPLIAKAAATKKPLIISTGMASLAEIDAAVHTARSAGCEQLALLKCTSTYPSSPCDSNVITLPYLSKLFGCVAGISDHTLGIGVSVASVALGGCIIEKHFTLNRDDGGIDSSFSMEPDEFTSLVTESNIAWQSLGKIYFGPNQSEIDSVSLRRSIYVSEDIQEGDTFSSSNLRIVRPGYGLSPSLLSHILGRSAKSSLKAGTPLTFDKLL